MLVYLGLRLGQHAQRLAASFEDGPSDQAATAVLVRASGHPMPQPCFQPGPATASLTRPKSHQGGLHSRVDFPNSRPPFHKPCFCSFHLICFPSTRTRSILTIYERVAAEKPPSVSRSRWSAPPPLPTSGPLPRAGRCAGDGGMHRRIRICGFA